MNSGPIGFTFPAGKTAKKAPPPGEKKDEKKGDEKKDSTPRAKKPDTTVLRAVSLLSQAIPYLRKFAAYKMNSKEKGTNQGEECSAVIKEIDAFLASLGGG